VQIAVTTSETRNILDLFSHNLPWALQVSLVTTCHIHNPATSGLLTPSAGEGRRWDYGWGGARVGSDISNYRSTGNHKPVITIIFIANYKHSQSIIRMIKSRMIIWARHVAWMGRSWMYIGGWWESQKERDHQEDRDVGGRIILKWILDRMMWYELGWSGSG
jgi:hypothetical protein